MSIASRASNARRMPRAAAAALLGTLLLAAGLAAAPDAAAAVPSPIDGGYNFNANGWTGTLSLSGVETGTPSVVMDYDQLGVPEYLTGSWNASTGTLTVYRPLPWNDSQTYVLYLGDHVPNGAVFGGYFTQSDVPGMRYGAYANNHLASDAIHLAPLASKGAAPVRASTITGPALAGPALTSANAAGAITDTMVAKPATAIHPDEEALPTDIMGDYAFDGNGWTGELLLAIQGCPAASAVLMTYDELGYSEPITDYDFNASTGTLTMVRPLSGGVTQTYTMYFGTHMEGGLMFGGYFTESDVPGMRYAAFAYGPGGGIGC